MTKKLILLISSILIFYFWTVTEGKMSLGKQRASAYESLAYSFSMGNLYLPYLPPEGLLKLSNPYNPVANKEYRHDLQDLSLYKGKLYLYFGPVPSLVFYLPYFLFTGMPLGNKIGVFVFMSGAFIFSVLILLQIKKTYFQSLPEWKLLISSLVLGLANFGPYILRRTAFYEVAIASGCFFFLSAIYFLIKSIDNNKKTTMLLLSGLSFALAIGSRYNLILSCFLSFLCYLFFFKERKLKDLCALILPALFSISSLAIYNFLRFGSIFETGFSYQLVFCGNRQESRGFSLFSNSFFGIIDRVPVILDNVYSYLFLLPSIKDKFPFIFAPFWNPPPMYPPLFERICGLIPSVPFVLLLLLLPLIIFKYRDKLQNLKYQKLPFFEIAVISIAGCANLFFIILLPYVCLRYSVDYAALLILASSISWFCFSSMDFNLKLKKTIDYFAVFVTFVSVVFGIAFSITGCYYGLRQQNFKLYEKLSSVFSFVSRLIKSRIFYHL